MMINLYQGDCLEIMPNIPDKSVDMILCDLPYGTTKCKWDIIIPMEDTTETEEKGLWYHYNRIIKDDGAIVLFGKEPFSSYLRTTNIEMFKYDWIWIKDTKSNFMQANNQPLNNIEIISVFSKGYARKIKDKIQMKYFPQFSEGKEYKIPKDSKTTDLFKNNHKNGVYSHSIRDTSKRYPYNTIRFNVDRNKVHPTQKPVELLKYLIKTYTNENDVVLDNCMGSGSTGIACKELNRNFIGIELDKNYFEIAERRINGN